MPPDLTRIPPPVSSTSNPRGFAAAAMAPHWQVPFTPEQVEALHRYQFGPFRERFEDGHLPMRQHPYTCPNRGDGHHFDNGSDLGALIPTVRGWICQCCDYKQEWAYSRAT